MSYGNGAMARTLMLFLVICWLVRQAGAEVVYIYADQGTCEECIQEAEDSLKNELTSDYDIKRIYAREILGDDWQANASLLVIPGGKAGLYAELLSGSGNAIIRQYIENGGKYLGLCAGGYYGGAKVKFAKGTNIEVIAKRELAFFPGTVVGPTLADYDYASEKGARIASVDWTMSSRSSPVRLYYNGGGHFKNAADLPNIRVIAVYDGLPSKLPAIIEAKVGDGVAILSGVHLEYRSQVLLRLDPAIFSSLPEIEQGRKDLLRHVLVNLGLNLKRN